MPTIQMLLELDYSMCNAMILPLKFKRVKRVFGAKPNQLKFTFDLLSTKRSLFKRIKTQFKNLINKIIRWIK